ncbi:hypothetical protein FRC02_005633, partial [Tulasnella sp. 418]
DEISSNGLDSGSSSPLPLFLVQHQKKQMEALGHQAVQQWLGSLPVTRVDLCCYLGVDYNPPASGVAYPPRSQLAGSSSMPVLHILPTAGSLSGSLPHDAASYLVDGLHVSLLLPDDAPTPTQSSRSTLVDI